mgnify:CR=1 FL=1
MHKVHYLNPISPKGTDLWTADYEKTENIAEAEAIMVRSAAMHDLDLPDSLAAVARAGAGVNNIPLDRCAENGIVVFNTPGANANAVKELKPSTRRSVRTLQSTFFFPLILLSSFR